MTAGLAEGIIWQEAFVRTDSRIARVFKYKTRLGFEPINLLDVDNRIRWEAAERTKQ